MQWNVAAHDGFITIAAALWSVRRAYCPDEHFVRVGTASRLWNRPHQLHSGDSTFAGAGCADGSRAAPCEEEVALLPASPQGRARCPTHSCGGTRLKISFLALKDERMCL